MSKFCLNALIFRKAILFQFSGNLGVIFKLFSPVGLIPKHSFCKDAAVQDTFGRELCHTSLR